ncbi:histidine kinase/DNA gyrase B/HSP90-like ATPase [Mumia flava]|uniref:Histidine kinase/DNA gyrase B/HSP90-like ATPase n=1 Tax=Mumia flava TaxID=1348852 RepID=A0A2M9B768_9ACTN|nr:histidine kinase/DNA gyrase B/HSP90-like ATPase [Mumia flava]
MRPGVGMLGLFPHMKYQPWYALGELVDNSIQSYVASRDRLRDLHGSDYRLRVEIVVDPTEGGMITVRDNAAGISVADWQRAFQVGEPPADTSGLSQFGIGMKAACCWFSRSWTLESSSIGEECKRTVLFDVPAIVEAHEENLVVRESVAPWDRHGTEIRMTSLHRTPRRRTVGKIRQYLGSIYRQFIRRGDVDIVFNGERIEYDEPAVLTAPLWKDPHGGAIEWRRPVDVTLRSGRRVLGFVAIRETGSTSMAGLALFYRDKVVTGAGEDTYRPERVFGAGNTFQSQRLFGELHMDEFDVTYTKDALVWHDEEDEFVELLRTELEDEDLPLLKQAQNYRSRTLSKGSTRQAETAAGNIASSLLAAPDLLTSPPAVPVEATFEHNSSTVGNNAGPQIHVDRELGMPIDGAVWKVSLRLVSDEGDDDWLGVATDVGSTGEPHVIIKVNQSHPFMRAYCELPGQELEPVWRVAVALGLGQELARKEGARMPSLVIRSVNSILLGYLSKKD